MWNDSNDRIMEIYDCIEDPKNKFPTTCPVCGKKAGHIYMHRHDAHHGGIWLWCSECQFFAHMSGIIPEWWQNLSSLDEVYLEAEPSYLDNRAKEIDEWVNTIHN